ncbi:MAG: hypothetical protein ACLR43_02930 [Faecalibacillus faecis]
MFIQQFNYSTVENYGKYTHGYINSVFTKGVLQSTDGYNYIVIDDDVYLYTGLTSVSKDAVMLDLH